MSEMKLRNLFYREFEAGTASYLAQGRPAGARRAPRFKWIGPIQGWKNCEIERLFLGRMVWRWGLMICNDVGLYMTFVHCAKWWGKALWCWMRYRGHDRGGMFDSCSRCAR